MNPYERATISRRKFLKTGVVGPLLIPLFLEDVGRAFAQSGGKPVLTIAALNDLFQQMHAHGPAQAARLYQAMQANLEEFFLDRFTINPRQLAMLREAIGTRGPSYHAFIQRALQGLQSGGPVAPPMAEFNPKLSPYVQVRGFGEEVKGCANVRLGALGPAKKPSPGADCLFVMNCVTLPRAC
jgi:hypothetical protein